ncbi:MAG: hypothetical protein GXZ04_05335 [Clostridiales bacterium]|nr:hypothetical protein [Clostridiales bacterium]
MKPTKRMYGLKAVLIQLRALIGPDAFIRRDTTKTALFASDANKRMDEKRYAQTARGLKDAGFLVQERDNYLLIDWPFSGYAMFFDQLKTRVPDTALVSAHGLARIYARHEGRFTPQMLPDARAALRCWDAGQNKALVMMAGEALAISLRTGSPVNSYYLPLLLTMEEQAR